LPEIEGTPSLSTRLMNPYMDRIMTAAESDIEVFEQFIRVAWLVDSPAKLSSQDVRAGYGGQAPETLRTDGRARLDGMGAT
jgi:hypothetical protein